MGGICPKCKSKINHLRNMVSGTSCYKMYVYEGEKYPDYDREDFYEDNNVNEWWCPECDSVLFTSEEEAIKFLKDTDDLQELVAEKIKKDKGG